MKHLSYIILCLLIPNLVYAASKSVVIGGPPAPMDVVDEAFTDYAVKAQGKQFLYRGPATSDGPWKIDHAGQYIRFLPIDANPTAITKGKGLVNKPIQWEDVDVKHEVNDGLVRVILTIKGGYAPTEYNWRVDASVPLTLNADGSVNIGDDMRIQTPWAVDANGDSVAVTVALSGPINGYYIYTKTINHVGASYPVKADPSVTIEPVANSGGRISGPNDTFTNTRDAATGTNNAFNIGAGAQWANPTWIMYRGFFSFPTADIPAGAVVDSATVNLYGTNDNSTVDTLLYLVSSFAGTVTGTGSYIQFAGRTAAARHQPVHMSDSINTSGYTAGYGNIWHLSANALDTLETADTLKLAILSAHDILNHTPSNADAWINYDGSDAGNDPVLTVYYHFPDGISAVSALDSTRIIVTYDTTGSGVAAGDTLHLTYSSAGDTVKATGYTLIGTNGLTDTVTVPYADSNYTVQARHSHTAGGYYTYLNNTGTVRTRAANTAPRMGGWSQKSIFLIPTNSINQTWTHMALICSTAAFGPKAFTTTGDTAAMADSSFNKFSVWDALADSIFSYPRFAIGAKVYLWAVWKNGDSLTTARSATMSDSLFGALTFTAGFLDSVRVTGSLAIASKPSWVTTRTSWLGASSSHADSAVSDTSTFTPGVTKLDTAVSKVRAITPNSKIALVGTVRLNPRDSLATSSADTIWTDPGYIRFTVERTTDTSWVFTMNYGSNPAGTLFDIIDSTLVGRDCTYVYYSPGDTLSAVPVYMTQASFPDTIKIVRNSGVRNPDSNRFQIIIHSGDSLDYNLGALWIPETPDRYVPRYALMIPPPGIPWRDERYEAQVQPVRRAT